MKYQVMISKRATENLEDIYNYISNDLNSPEYAFRVYEILSSAVLSLETFPNRGKVVEFEPERSLGLRKIITGRYLIFYLVQHDRVIVTNILYSSRDIESLIK